MKYLFIFLSLLTHTTSILQASEQQSIRQKIFNCFSFCCCCKKSSNEIYLPVSPVSEMATAFTSPKSNRSCNNSPEAAPQDYPSTASSPVMVSAPEETFTENNQQNGFLANIWPW